MLFPSDCGHALLQIRRVRRAKRHALHLTIRVKARWLTLNALRIVERLMDSPAVCLQDLTRQDDKKGNRVAPLSASRAD